VANNWLPNVSDVSSADKLDQTIEVTKHQCVM